MPIEISVQAYTFLYSVLCGMLIGFIYDLLRIKRKTIKTGALFINVEDLAYWIIAATIVFALIFYSNSGEIRGYIFIGIVIGDILYTLLLSNLIVKLSVKILDLLGRIIKFVLFVILYPVKIIIKIISYPVKLISRPVKKLLKSIKARSRIKLIKISLLKKTIRNMFKKI
ncbi:MAG: spore cortex biosynthesis protein YabQ [Clostridiaceae bacterium]|nr:spore cortex biosynthesis protein YabQ [Clostridiaceae bacterium]